MQLETFAQDLREYGYQEGRYSREMLETCSDEDIITLYTMCPYCGREIIPSKSTLWSVRSNCADTFDSLYGGRETIPSESKLWSMISGCADTVAFLCIWQFYACQQFKVDNQCRIDWAIARRDEAPVTASEDPESSNEGPESSPVNVVKLLMYHNMQQMPIF
jgi:hypothetical protein